MAQLSSQSSLVQNDLHAHICRASESTVQQMYLFKERNKSFPAGHKMSSNSLYYSLFPVCVHWRPQSIKYEF